MAYNNKYSQKKKNEFTLTWWILTIIISFIISAVIIWIMHMVWHKDLANVKVEEIFKQGPASVLPLPSIDRKTTILAMGVDSNGRNADPFKGTRSDTMILAALDPKTKTIGALSIPRDSKVYIAGNRGIDKINAAHAYGGPEAAVETVENTLGVDVDHYILVDYHGLKELIKALGGVEVYVEKRMKYTDFTGKLFVDLQPGKQLLDADHAEQYLRFRHDPEGDIGRMRRQQWFMRGVLERLKSPSIVLKLPQLIQLAQKYVKTDMNLGQMMQLAGFVKGIDFNKIQISTLPGGPSSHGYISYWIIDVNAAQLLVDRLIHGYEEIDVANNNIGEPITLSIMYNNDEKENLNLLLEDLNNSDYKVVCKNPTKEVRTKIVAHSNRATLDQTNLLRQNAKELINSPIFIQPTTIYCTPSDYTIVLGKDH